MSAQIPEGSQAEPKDTPPIEEPKAGDTPAETPPANPAEQQADPLDELPEWARKELKTVRSEAAARRIKERELQAQLEGAVSPEEHERIVKELRDSLAETTRRVLTTDVIREFDLPDDEDTREFLTASDEEGLKKQAEKLSKLLKAAAPQTDPDLPEPLEPRGGKNPASDPTPSPGELKQVLARKRRRF